MIEAEQLAKSFGPRTALAGVDLSIAAGEFVTLLGPNGAGKTTLLRVLATLSRPSSGSVRIAGLDPERDGEPVRRTIGFLSHRTLLYDDLTAEENLRFYARAYDIADGPRRVDELLERVGLEMRRRDRVRSFSHGLKQRLAVARAVLHNPRVLLLDEPYAGLDAQAVVTLTDLLTELADEGCAIVLATHRILRGLTAGGRVLILHRGRLVYDQPRAAVSPEDFLEIYGSVTSS